MKQSFDFEAKVRSMTMSEIVMAMVKGLRAEHVKVDMGTFGDVREGVCYGCAATNTVCEIVGGGIPERYIRQPRSHAQFLGVRQVFLNYFELAIDQIRKNQKGGYETLITLLDLAPLPEELDQWRRLNLRYLDECNGSYLNDLAGYETFAGKLREYEAQHPAVN